VWREVPKVGGGARPDRPKAVQTEANKGAGRESALFVVLCPALVNWIWRILSALTMFVLG
jgi:hypothetical protein